MLYMFLYLSYFFCIVVDVVDVEIKFHALKG